VIVTELLPVVWIAANGCVGSPSRSHMNSGSPELGRLLHSDVLLEE